MTYQVVDVTDMIPKLKKRISKTGIKISSSHVSKRQRDRERKEGGLALRRGQ